MASPYRSADLNLAPTNVNPRGGGGGEMWKIGGDLTRNPLHRWEVDRVHLLGGQ